MNTTIYPEFEKVQSDEHTVCRAANCSNLAIVKILVSVELPEIGATFGRLNLCASCAQKIFAALVPIPTPKQEKNPNDTAE